MASLIVPKWMRSEFRSDIITRANGVKLAPACNKLRPYAYKSLRHQPESEGCKNGIKTAARQIDLHRFAANTNCSSKLRLKISLPTSNNSGD
jgi:hypothetical protein